MERRRTDHVGVILRLLSIFLHENGALTFAQSHLRSQFYVQNTGGDTNYDFDMYPPSMRQIANRFWLKTNLANALNLNKQRDKLKSTLIRQLHFQLNFFSDRAESRKHFQMELKRPSDFLEITEPKKQKVNSQTKQEWTLQVHGDDAETEKAQKEWKLNAATREVQLGRNSFASSEKSLSRFQVSISLLEDGTLIATRLGQNPSVVKRAKGGVLETLQKDEKFQLNSGDVLFLLPNQFPISVTSSSTSSSASLSTTKNDKTDLKQDIETLKEMLPHLDDETILSAMSSANFDFHTALELLLSSHSSPLDAPSSPSSHSSSSSSSAKYQGFKLNALKGRKEDAISLNSLIHVPLLLHSF